MDWVVYAALILGFLAIVAGLVLLVIRLLQTWRAFKRLRRHLARELNHLADLGERTAEGAARALDTAELDATVGHLRVTLACFALLREAVGEAAGTFGRVAAVYPRK